MHTLVLNNDASPLSLIPLSVISWEEAIKLWYLDRVDILHSYEDWVVHSPSTKINVPSVVMVREYINKDKKVIFSRHNVFIRDGYTCQYCGNQFPENQLTLDHVVPRAHGGLTKWENVVACCQEDNTKKADRRVMNPLRPPFKPSYGDMLIMKQAIPPKIRHESWKPYLGLE